jgi:adenosylcobinamide kinase/adenosylcobinamide-phosphate guanylyltransferase
MKKKVTLITGGGRSGKSRLALERAEHYSRKGFVATAVPFDDEMKLRIAKHRSDRDPAYITIEAPIELSAGIRALEGDADVAVVDCLTVWLGNLMHRHGESECDPPEIGDLLDLLKAPPMELILVTNEVGSGIIPPNRMSREFRDLAGFMNQSVAAVADEVILAVCGLPVQLKAG